MDSLEIKKALRFEYKLKTGEYLALNLGYVMERDALSIFEIDFRLNLHTDLFCTRKLKDGRNDYEVVKIVTVQNDGNCITSNSIQGFVDYIKDLDIVEKIHTY